MKTKTAIIYLGVLLVLAGYFYYFEVIRREVLDKAKEAALHLFQVEKDQITAFELNRADTKPISLKKEGHWQVVAPLSTRADDSAVGALLAALQSLKIEREVDPAAKDLQTFGLDEPTLQLSFLAGDTRHHLRIGSKAVVGNQFYASGDQEGRVVLIASSQQHSLDKTLFDLRSKRLFTVQEEKVDRVEVERTGDRMVLSRLEKDRWQAPAAPQIKIKTAKVKSLLNRLIWLRADRFLEDQQGDVSQLGLAPPQIRLSISAQDKKETLLLGNVKKDGGVYVKAEELPGLAMINEGFLDDLPKGLSDLEDHTLLPFAPEKVASLALDLDDASARLERQGEEWKWIDSGDRKDPETWRVNSLLWKLQELECLAGTQPREKSLPEKQSMRLALFGENEHQLGKFFIPFIPDDKQKNTVLWFSKGTEEPRPYWAAGESVRGLHQSVKDLIAPPS